MYFIGTTDHRGTYFFHSKQHRGWIVADLDSGKCHLVNHLVTVRCDPNADIYDEVNRVAMGNESRQGEDYERFLLNHDDFLILLRDDEWHELEGLMVYQQDGTEGVYGEQADKAGRTLGDVLRRGKKRLQDDEEG